MSSEVRVVLADDHVVLRLGLRSFLEEQENPPLRVVGEAGNGEEAIELVEKLRPELLLLDLSMPGLGGIGATLELRLRGVTARILVLTQYAESVYLKRVFEAGADGYILKTARGDELLTAIRSVLGGGKWIDPALASSLVPGATSADAAPTSDEEALARLTPRELQVLRLVAEGYKNREVADALDVAVRTAMAHRANLMEKLNIHNTSKLTQFAMRMGITTLR